jgi:ABC-type Fe3+ transport system permease subunit
LELKRIEKSGAIFSTVGLALLIAFIIVLLAFPIIKQCQRSTEQCKFYSTAPDSVRFIVRPVFLATALIIIAIGVGTTRFAIWYQYRKIKKSM